jgi:serine/threonine protein kinase
VSSLQEQLQSALGAAYVLERELGGGGMSRVFQAHETALGRKVVVKVLLPELAAGVNVERFRREIQLAAQLQHPHIVPLLSAGEADGLPYLIMPFVSGESLRARLAREGELPIAETVRILRDVVSALAYAHSFGVVHRDVKPDNVLLSGGVAVVTDFGVAKAVTASADAAQSGLTSLGVALGTPAYMAPEQAAAQPQIDHRADLYALGVMAYELLSGNTPFVGRPVHAVLAAQVMEDPEPVERRRNAVPPLLAALVRDCMAKRPADRPQTAAQVMHMLDSIATPSGGTAATTAVRVSAASPARPPRRRILVGSAIVFAILISAGLILLSRKRPERVTERPLRDSGAAVPSVPTPPPQQEVAEALTDTEPRKVPPTKTTVPPRRGRGTERAQRAAPARPSRDTAAAPALGETPAARESVPSPEPSPTLAAPPVAVESSKAVPAPVAPPPAPPVQPTRQPADVQQELAGTVARYARAIEAENVAGIRQVYPGMTPVQQRGWEQFFQLVRDVKADLALSHLQLTSGGAEAQVSGTYSYQNTSTGRAERQPVSFHVSFRQHGGAWEMTQVR